MELALKSVIIFVVIRMLNDYILAFNPYTGESSIALAINASFRF